MRIKLRHLWEMLTTGYWFVPAVMTALAMGLGALMLYIDRALLRQDVPSSWVYSGGPEGARALLAAIAGSIITVAGVVFSITMVAITQASSQYGPRLLRNFMRDTVNQVVLGTFIATFVYCLLILRTIRGSAQTTFVPHLSVTIGVLLALVSIAVLIYFIHHVSWSLQATSVVAAAAADLDRSIGQLEDDAPGGQQRNADDDRVDNGNPKESDCKVIDAPCDGYVQAIDYPRVVSRVAAAEVRVWLQRRPGDFVVCGTPLAQVHPPDACTPDLLRELQGAFLIGSEPTPEQDIEYAIRQMVEVAVRALSPGINDPFTAINCVDMLGAALCRIAHHRLPAAHYHDSQGNVRVITRTVTFASIIDASFSMIRQYGRSSPAVLIRLLDVIVQIAPRLSHPNQRQALIRHVEMIEQDGQDAIPREQDREDLRRRFDAAVAALRRT